MRVPFLDLASPHSEIRGDIEAAFSRVLDGSSFIGGAEGRAFETEFAQYCGTEFAVGAGNGLDALHLLLRAHGIGPGDEVIVPSNTFIATWLAVTHCGAKPVPVEPDETTYNIDPHRIEAAITPATKAIIPVHLYGQPADMTSIMAIARRRGLLVFEDAAQAQGAELKGKRAGALADGAAFSFYPGKNLGALGDAGAITTDNSKIASLVRELGNYGSKQKYLHDILGYNTRLDEVQAAVLRTKLRVLDNWNQTRAEIAEEYRKHIDGSLVKLPQVLAHAKSVWHLFVVRVPEREQIQKALTAKGITTLIHYPTAPGASGAYRGHVDPKLTKIADKLALEVLSLPMGPHLSSDQARYVADSLNEAVHATLR